MINMLVYQILTSTLHVKKKKKSYKSSGIAAPTWNEKFESPCGSYSLPDIQDYFKCIIKKHEKETENFPIRTYIKQKIG